MYHEPHKTVSMWNPFLEAEVEIDEGISPLILLLWYEVELETLNSCEDNFGSVWLQFLSFVDLEQFLTFLAQARDQYPILYEEMMTEWRYNLVPDDLAEVLDPEKDEVFMDGPSQIILPPSVRFPKEDLDIVLEVVRFISEMNAYSADE